MAYASKTLATSGGYSKGFTLSISWSENSTDASNNTSNITATATLAKLEANFWVTGAGILRCYWHDDKTNTDDLVSESWIDEIGYQQNSRSTGGTFNREHKADGTLNGYAWAQWEVRNTQGGYAPVSGSIATDWVALTATPRASQPSINTWPNNSPDFYIGDRIAIHMNRKSSSFTHTVVINYGNTSYTIGTGVTDYCVFETSTIANDLYAQIPSARNYANTITVTTYSGNTVIGTKTCDYNAIAVENNIRPWFPDFAYYDSNGTTSAITGNNSVMISGKSSLAVEISAANKAIAQQSAWMTKYTYQVAGLNAEDWYSDYTIIRNMGTPWVGSNELPSGYRDLVVTAIDSRGISSTITKTVTIVPYNSPILNATATRANGFENTTTVHFAGSFSRIEVGGTAKNTVDTNTGVRYRYKSQNTSTWGSWTNITVSVDANTGQVSASDFTLNLDNQTAYDFQFEMTDRLETASQSLVVAVGQPPFWIGADGRASVGGMPTHSKAAGTNGLLDVKGDIYADNQIYKNGVAVLNQNEGSMYTFNKTSWGLNFDDLHYIAATYRVVSTTSVPFGANWYGTLVCVGDERYMQQIAIANYVVGQTEQRMAMRTWVSESGDWNGYWSGWTMVKSETPNKDWQFIGAAYSTDERYNEILRVEIPAEYQNCSLKVVAKIELATNGWIDLRAYNASGNPNFYTVNTVYSRNGIGGGETYSGCYYMAALNDTSGAYRSVNFKAESIKLSSSPNWRTWLTESGNGFMINQTSARQESGDEIGSIQLWAGAAAQAGCVLKVWGMKD